MLQESSYNVYAENKRALQFSTLLTPYFGKDGRHIKKLLLSYYPMQTRFRMCLHTKEEILNCDVSDKSLTVKSFSSAKSWTVK